MIFPPLFAFFGKTRSADSGHGSLSRRWFGDGAVRGVFGVDEVEGCGKGPRYGGRRGCLSVEVP